MEGMDSVTSGTINTAVQESQQEPQQAPLHSPIMTMGEIVEGLVQSDTDARLGRLIDHVNREIGVADDVPLCMRLETLVTLWREDRAKIKEKTKLLD